MDVRRAAWWAVALALVVAACEPRALEPVEGSTGGSTGAGGTFGSPAQDLATMLRDLKHPSVLLVVSGSVGTVVDTRDRSVVRVFAQDPGTLVEAAAVVAMPVCSVEPYELGSVLTIDGALDICFSDDLADMLPRLAALKTAATVVIIAANTAVTVRSTNNGINFFYDTDIIRLLRAARRLYVPACIVIPDSLAVSTYPTGQTPGLSTDEALARCGRL